MAGAAPYASLFETAGAKYGFNPTLLAAAPTEDRRDLMEATEIFDGVLARHALAVEAARTISEGLVRTIAQEVTATRTPASAYASDGRAAQGDGRAVALNRMA